ncbi:PepSY domain-containing protein [Helicobacter sp. MIT 14-3879]|uniref:PepSY domain-containing protein n=1 Tax=Helicobacter sp. MIT 14-3879 TaxID=2040649 RepID=UPI000E1E62E2|nr:PepSY domain-containing protein [Helicobacter sp. MIT 14-3879]RDU60577.1 hypothetical protein CQA44_10460 [Helicobacter sp. MIT 14-3879]
MKITRKNWMQIHTYLSLFFLPAAMIYALTGALYIFDIREDAGATIHEYKLESAPKKGEEVQFMIALLQKHNLEIPKNTEMRNHRGNPTIGNIRYNVSIIKEQNGSFILRTVDRSLYGILVLMHKSKGKYYFDIVAVGFSVSLMLFYLSGLIVTSFAKANRKTAFGILGLGFIITAMAVYYSV